MECLVRSLSAVLRKVCSPAIVASYRLPACRILPLAMAAAMLPAAGHAATLMINEIDVDQTGTDSLEFVELYDGGAGFTSLADYRLVFYNGTNDSIYQVVSLEGQQTSATGLFVVGSSALGVADLDWTTLGLGETNRIQNGADAIALYAGSPMLNIGDGISTTGLVDAIVYGTSDPDDAGLLTLLGSGPGVLQVDENADGNSSTFSISRVTLGTLDGTAFALLEPTPGALNTTTPVPLPGSAWLLLSGLIALVRGRSAKA